MKTSVILLSLVGLSWNFSVENIVKSDQTSPSSAVKNAGLTSPDIESHANPPFPALPETTQIRGHHTTVRTQKVLKPEIKSFLHHHH